MEGPVVWSFTHDTTGSRLCLDGSKVVLDMVGHLLRPEEQREFFGMVVAAIEGCLFKRDELLARERKRLGKPSDNREGAQ